MSVDGLLVVGKGLVGLVWDCKGLLIYLGELELEGTRGSRAAE